MGFDSPLTSQAVPSDRDRPGSPAAVAVCCVLLGLLVTAFWIAGPEIGSPTSEDRIATSGQRIFPPAREIQGIENWINSEPLSLKELRGRVVLLDFWTYTCVNCIRTVPQLKDWHNRYADDGLTIVGIHTPEFEFEKDPGNVRTAVDAHGISWPVAMDNEYVTWDNYGNAFWPTKYLIDDRGRLRYHRVGEGNYSTFEDQLRALLLEAGQDLSDDPPTTANDHLNDAKYEESPDRAITRELYTGYERGDFQREYFGAGFVGQHEYYIQPGQVLDLDEPAYLEPDMLYFKGQWINGEQQAAHARQTADFEDYVTLVYSARSVNAVLSAERGEGFKVRVLMDDEYLTEENRGADIEIGPDGESYLWVDRPRMYQVVENSTYVQRKTLRLSSNAEGFGIYAFTFGIYAQGP